MTYAGIPSRQLDGRTIWHRVARHHQEVAGCGLEIPPLAPRRDRLPGWRVILCGHCWPGGKRGRRDVPRR